MPARLTPLRRPPPPGCSDLSRYDRRCPVSPPNRLRHCSSVTASSSRPYVSTAPRSSEPCFSEAYRQKPRAAEPARFCRPSRLVEGGGTGFEDVPRIRILPSCLSPANGISPDKNSANARSLGKRRAAVVSAPGVALTGGRRLAVSVLGTSGKFPTTSAVTLSPRHAHDYEGRRLGRPFSNVNLTNAEACAHSNVTPGRSR